MRQTGLKTEDDEMNERFITEKESEIKVCLSILSKLKDEYQPKEEVKQNQLIRQVQEIPMTSIPTKVESKETSQQPVT